MCSSAGCTQYLFPKGPDDPPRNYFVPDFGLDNDILSAQQNEANAKKFLALAKNKPKLPEEETSIE